MEPKLPAKITPGIVNVPGRGPRDQALAESLLEQDRQKHHCFFNPRGFHNHLSHHLLAAYDLGAPGALLQAIYDAESPTQKPIDGENDTSLEQVRITPDNFNKYVGQERYYHAFLRFFTERVKEFGASETMENYVFSPAVNLEGVQMLARFMGGLYHPLIQTGYGAEFGSEAMIAQGLAQAAVHSPLISNLLDLTVPGITEDASNTSVGDGRGAGKPLLHILRDIYGSDTLKPVPYDPEKNIAQCRVATMQDGRAEEIKKLCATWWSISSLEGRGLEGKVEELFWATTLLLVGTSKRGHKARLDFALVHAMNATLFLPSLLRIIPSSRSKVQLLKAFLPVTMMYVIARGRPRIDAAFAMSHDSTPRPSRQPSDKHMPSPHAVGDPSGTSNPWMVIILSAIHNPDAHAIKATRMLCHAAQHYGHKKGDEIPGCFIVLDEDQREETLPGTAELDGTLFVRAAGVVVDTLGWVGHGDNPGGWDFSGLGWDESWKHSDRL